MPLLWCIGLIFTYESLQYGVQGDPHKPPHGSPTCEKVEIMIVTHFQFVTAKLEVDADCYLHFLCMLRSPVEPHKGIPKLLGDMHFFGK